MPRGAHERLQRCPHGQPDLSSFRAWLTVSCLPTINHLYYTGVFCEGSKSDRCAARIYLLRVFYRPRLPAVGNVLKLGAVPLLPVVVDQHMIRQHGEFRRVKRLVRALTNSSREDESYPTGSHDLTAGLCVLPPILSVWRAHLARRLFSRIVVFEMSYVSHGCSLLSATD